MLVIPAGYVQASLHHSIIGGSREAVCTVGVKYADGAPGVTFQALALAVADAWAETVVEEMSANVIFNRCKLRDADGVVGEVAVSGAQGLDADPPVPPNTTYLVKKVSASPGRETTGRIYMPGVTEEQIDGLGNIGTPKRNALQTAWTEFLNRADNVSGIEEWVILHNSPQLDGAPPPTVITGFLVDPRVATQRRRLRG